MAAIWNGWDQQTLDREYNARASVPDYDVEVGRYRTLSAAARAVLPHTPGLVFDPQSGNTLDWFPGAPGGPVLLWVHGGYWRALGRQDQGCVAPGLVAAGVHVAVMDYTLVPAATLDEIVRQVRSACAWVTAHAAGLGADPARLFVGGSSAGGHLAGMVLSAGWHAGFGLRPDAVRGAVALSGLYDMDPVRLSFVNDWMGLTAADAARLSPIHLIPPTGPAPRLLATYGTLETGEFQRQTEAYAAVWTAAGHQAHVAPQPSRNHFNIVTALGEAADPMCQAAAAFLLA